MKKSDATIDAALEYESAVLHALSTLDHADTEIQIDACLRFADAVARIEALPVPEYNRSGLFLTERNRIPAGAWQRIKERFEVLSLMTRAPQGRA